jgi:hypothetical protein
MNLFHNDILLVDPDSNWYHSSTPAKGKTHGSLASSGFYTRGGAFTFWGN